MTKQVRWGLLSTAYINRRIIPAIRMAKRSTLVAVASRDRSKGEAYARNWEIPTVFGSYEDMLNSDEVDAVYISLPNHLHAEWSIKALQAGKNVLCEKPFALTVEEVDAVAAARKASGCAIAEAFMYRHHPQTRLVGEWVQSGRLGDISMVRAYFSFAMRNPEGNVRMVPAYGGGSLWDVGVYPISFAQFVMGKSAPVWVAGSRWVGSRGVDEDFNGLLTYSGERAAQIGCSFRVPYTTEAEILGTSGRLTLTRPFTLMDSPERAVIFTPAEGRPRRLRVPSKELYLGEVEDIEAAILDGKPTFIELSETRNHVRTVQALQESASQGKIVHLAAGD